MNIKITYNWLLEYLETEANPDEIQKYLSLSGPSIETISKIGNDYIFDIEITSNRIDTASVLGIAQESLAILPQFGKKAKLKINPLNYYRFDSIRALYDRTRHVLPLYVKLEDKSICSRFDAIILDNIQIKPSPDFISKRLTVCGIKSINNVIDISNYLMIALGQPVHIFDYDQVKKSTMIMRNSRKGEKIITLDEKEIVLPGEDIVIEDGQGRLIDLCGIMGGLNSSVTDKTKRVILFVQTYNKEIIRKTVMTTRVRTVAATYFEKGLDEERVEPTLVYGVELLKKYADGKIASKITDIYPRPYQQKKINIKYNLFDKLIGVKLKRELIDQILTNLGFKLVKIAHDRGQSCTVIVPSYRKYDINILEDLVEEVARIHGYHKLPNRLSPPANVQQPEEFEKLFTVMSKIKYFLKHLGLTETINYSMISEEMLEDFDQKINDHLKISNTISNEIEYMRISLIPSLIKNIKDNTGKKDLLKFFEIAKVYLAQKNDLPKEIYKLGIAVNTNYFDLKGIVEALLKELNIKKETQEKIIKKNKAFFIEIDLNWLIENWRPMPVYQPVNPFAVVKLDKTFTLSKNMTYEVIQRLAYRSKLLKKIENLDLFQNKLTIRFYFNSPKQNITEDEAKQELKELEKALGSV